MGNLITYLFLLVEFGHETAKHMVYHERFEVWVLDDFKLSDKKDGWNSEHKVTCTMCDHSRLGKRFWLMASKWSGVGSKTEDDARRKAILLNQYS